MNEEWTAEAKRSHSDVGVVIASEAWQSKKWIVI